ncbi:MAG: hypothetical protein WC479_09585 [Candidatus Izemoplasmatales bacterium]|jgi:hypothetical protein
MSSDLFESVSVGDTVGDDAKCFMITHMRQETSYSVPEARVGKVWYTKSAFNARWKYVIRRRSRR